jgi:hypothetical protein
MMTDLLKRFVPAAEMEPGVLAQFHSARNILFINKDVWDRADKHERREMWRCTGTVMLDDIEHEKPRHHNKRDLNRTRGARG